MLLSTFVVRRAPQNPAVIVTACTGILCSFAYGDLSKNSTPSSFQSALGALAPACQVAPSNPRAGTTLTAAADTAAPTNSRRVNFAFFAMLASPDPPIVLPQCLSLPF